MFNQRLPEHIMDIYELAEALKLKTWYIVERIQDEQEWSGKINPEDRLIDAKATFDGKVLKIVVNDCLPRRPSLKPIIETTSILRAYWLGNVTNAIRKLPEPVKFERALCIIKTFTPQDIEWDVDNRAFNMIINALKIAGVVPGDSWDKLSILLLGGVDRNNPRTEIIAMDYPENTINSLIN